MESIQATKLRNGKECADSNKQANGPRAKRKKKDSAMHFLLGTQSESKSIGTCSHEMECFLKQPSLDPDLNALEWWREKAEEYPTLSEVANNSCVYLMLHLFLLNEFFQHLETVLQKRELASSQRMWTC